jgi:hypothetical protein
MPSTRLRKSEVFACAEHDVLGRERRAVVEAHARAQLELPMRRVEDFPGRGKLRHDRQVGIDIEECLVDLEGRSLVVFDSVGMGVHGRRPGVLAREAQHVFGRGRGGDGERSEHGEAGER